MVKGGNNLTAGPATEERKAEVLASVVAKGFGHKEQATTTPGTPCVMPRAQYAAMFGPTTSDRVSTKALP
eukprot:SAG22_NODE_10255_length_545_cov_0.706278_2_plen_69_part_01